MLVWRASSSTPLIGTENLLTIRKLARLAVYEDAEKSEMHYFVQAVCRMEFILELTPGLELIQ